MEGAEGVTIRWLISKKDGAPNFQMRLFEVAPGGHTPLHIHEWEHEVYILEGEGVLTYEGKDNPFSAGHFVFVPAGKERKEVINKGFFPLCSLCLCGPTLINTDTSFGLRIAGIQYPVSSINFFNPSIPQFLYSASGISFWYASHQKNARIFRVL